MITTGGPGSCRDCGRPTSGVRCRPCNGKFIALEAARALAESDAELLRLVDEEKVSKASIAIRENVTPQRIQTKVRKARLRQQMLREEVK